MGRSHLVANTAIALGAGMALHRLSRGGLGWPELVEGPVVQGASWVWESLFPHGVAWWWLLGAAVLFWIGSLLPDIDNAKSILGRRLPFAVPGPHRGITHSDWLLLVLLLVSMPQATRILVFLWLGAALHCELDGWSTAGRARFWPLGRYKVISVGGGASGGQPCVVVPRPRALSYRTGGPGEVVALLLCVGLGACLAGFALAA